MKTNISIAVIVAGVALISVPPLFDYLGHRVTAQVLDTARSNSGLSISDMGRAAYSAACFLGGIAMISVAIYGSWRPKDDR